MIASMLRRPIFLAVLDGTNKMSPARNCTSSALPDIKCFKSTGISTRVEEPATGRRIRAFDPAAVACNPSAIQTRISKGTYGILAQEEPICCHVCCGYIQARINA